MLHELKPLDRSLFAPGTYGANGYCSHCAKVGDRDVFALYMAKDNAGIRHALCYQHADRAAQKYHGLTIKEIDQARKLAARAWGAPVDVASER